ncbi:MAG: ChaN family lipoprotein, partial [Bdellovibrionales bacterium]|nr:ChaN family lipoprotein [Bdellovibrionales bacterium]
MVKNDNWVRATRRILRQVKVRVRDYVGTMTPALQEYERRFLSEFHGDWKATSKSVLLSEVGRSKIVLGSDFHAFPQSQRTHLRILRELSPAREVVLALECVETRFQEWIDRFLAGQIGEKEFLVRICWNEHWGFPFENYRPLFEIARERGYQIRGINSHLRGRTQQVLVRRDRMAAREILKIEKEISLGGLVYVVFGEMHLAAGHLPKMLKMRAVQSRNQETDPLIIFQNSERLYYQLANGRRELRTNVLKRGKRKFCVMNAPPWVPWQHYALFLENSSDRDLEFEEGPAELEFTSAVHELLGIIGGQLGIKRKWDDYTVLPVGNRYLWTLLKRVLAPRDLKLAESSLIKGRSLFFPQGGLMALARPTLNHAAQLCGQYIQSRLSGRSDV